MKKKNKKEAIAIGMHRAARPDEVFLRSKIHNLTPDQKTANLQEALNQQILQAHRCWFRL